jgi:amino acid adenylation domain-containing protein
MDCQANQLAHRLRSLGVGPDVVVGLYLDRSPTIIVAALAVWKAGGAYLPLDPTFPAERIEFYISDSKARVVIGIGAPSAKLRLPSDVAEVSLHGDRVQIEQNSSEPPPPTSRPEHLAYVIYTSGSTGTPKGVAVQHSALVNLLNSVADEPGLCGGDVMLGLTTMSFDIHALELWLPLSRGARIELVDRDVAMDGLQLARKLKSTRPTVAQATPTTWRMLRAAGWDGDPNLKVLCGGETMPPDLAADLVGRVRELWNMYGPTETTVWSTLHRVTSAEGPISIGRPIANTQIFILDEQHRPLPPGVVGDLAIGGAGLARGYLNRPELTAERFIESRFGRLYLTGDRARWRDDGILEFLGRNDQQVKLRGHRIELAEIESALARYPAVEHAAAALRNDRLIAYIVPRPATRPNLDDLRQSLRGTLPEPMIPSHIVLLEALPKTNGGKLNRAALPAPEAVLDRQQIAPRFDIERDLAAVWEEVLDVRPIGVTDDFFELRGHSYLAAVLLARIQQRLGHTLPLGALFAAPTVEKLAVALQQRLETGSGSSLVALREEGRRPPLFLIAGVGGHVFAFHKFAQLLGPDQPAYGVKAIGVDGVAQPLDRMEPIAAHYAEEITRERPTGPVVLGGYSIGAIAAFELAVQLQQTGREVGPLIVFDMTAPGYPKLKSLPRRLLVHAGNVLRGNGAGRGAYLRERLTNLRGRMFDALGLSRWNAPHLDVASLPQDALQRVWIALREAQRSYKPSRKFAGRVILFKAAEVPAWTAAAFDDPDLGWGEWATAGVERITIPGGHLDMFRENNLDSVAAMLRDRLK